MGMYILAFLKGGGRMVSSLSLQVSRFDPLLQHVELNL